MNFQQKVFESPLFSRAATLAQNALETARDRATVAAKFLEQRAGRRVSEIKGSLGTLSVAGRALEKVARRHGAKFVKQNATIASAARKDVTALARETFDSLAKRGATPKKRAPARKSAAKRVAKAA
jgi:hypothetical protein